MTLNQNSFGLFRANFVAITKILQSVFCPTICLMICLAFPSLAQNIQHTQNTADASLRGNLQVDPSTLGMSLQIPLGEYGGRNGLNLPISISYGSKQWRIETIAGFNGVTAYHTQSNVMYSEHSVSGWTGSLDVPVIEYLGDSQPYSGNTGDAWCIPCIDRPDETPYYIDRLLIHLPDGSTHELRKNDIPQTGQGLGMSGFFHAVDGSRIKFDAENAIIYLPDGSRYLLSPSVGDAQYVDRNGNTLTYNSSLQQWTDTMARVIGLPPLQNDVAGVRTYSLPGLGASNRTFTFRWRLLQDVLTIPGQPLRYTGDRECIQYPNEPHLSPNLFNSVAVLDSVCGGVLFNPVVLWKIELPNGVSSYTFTYNIYGEVDKVVMPTGGYERFVYSEVDNLSALAPPYKQVNRGVTEHFISAKGDGSDEVRWQYAASNNANNGEFKTTVTGPNGAKSERILHGGVTSTVPNPEFGMEDARAGRAYEERTYNSSGQMIRRSLVDWTMDVTQLTFLAVPYKATRNPRSEKRVEILLDTGGNALAAITTSAYDNDLNEIASTRYDYVSVDPATAQTGNIYSFLAGTQLRSEETTFLVNDTNLPLATRQAYRDRHLISLPTVTRVKDGSTTVAETKFRYDETPLMTYPFVTGWVDPATIYRGNVTTTERWLNLTGQYLTSQLEYDQCGNLRKTTDARGKISEVFYTDNFADAVNRNTFAYPTSTKSPKPDPTGAYGSNQELTASTKYDYRSGKVMTTTDANNQVTSYSYNLVSGNSPDPLMRLGKVTLPDGGETTYEYGDTPYSAANPYDLFVYVTTKQNGTTSVSDGTQFDGLGRAWRSSHLESASPVQVSLTDTEYDTLGRVKRVSNPYTATNLIGPINPSGIWTTTTYDDLNRALTITAADGAVTATVYSGNQVTVTDAAGKSRRSITDGLGRLSQVTEDPGASPHLNYQTNYSYDTLGNLTVVNQGGQQRFFFYDSLSRLVRAKNPEQDTNALLAISPAPTYNNNWSLGYTYDANGNLLTRTDARGVVTTYAYDDINRNKTVTYSDGTPSVERHYDGATNGKGRFHFNYSGGNFSTGANVEHTAVDSYDVLGRPLTGRQLFKTNNVWSQTFSSQRSYDLMGHVTGQTYPSTRTVSYGYGADGRLAAFSGNLGGTSRTYSDAMAYAPSGQMLRETFHTSTLLYHQMEYNTRLQVTGIGLGTTLGDLSTVGTSWNRGRLSFVWGATPTTNNGNLTEQTVSMQLNKTYFLKSVYQYDDLNRLASVNESQYGINVPYEDIAGQAYGYDRWGNRTSVVGTVNSQSWNTTEASLTNRLKLTSGNNCAGKNPKNGLCYDAAGNVIFDNQLGDSGDRLYDAENRMTSAVGVKGSSSSYSYDADGRRTRRQADGQTYWQVYGLGGELVAEYLWNGTTAVLQKEYGYRGGEMLIVAESASVARWLVTDHLGTPRFIADQTGSLAGITRHDYLPFGEENFAGSVRIGNGYQKDEVRQQFTGYEHDTETDLDFAEARYCSTKQGRFTSVDPLHSSAEITEPQSWNRYSYVGNHPLTIADPNGLKWAYKTDKNGFLHFKYFNNDADAVAQGWTVIEGNYFYIGSSGHVIGLYTNGGGRDFGRVRQVSNRINIWADTPETNAIFSLWIKSVIAGSTLGAGAAAGAFTLPEVAGASAYYADGIVRGGVESGSVGTAATVQSGGLIDPFEVRFSQDSAGYEFRNGAGNIDTLANQLRSGEVRSADVAPIRLVELDGKLYTLDNRRLEAFRRAGVDIQYRMATPSEVSRDGWKFTTKNDGSSIRIRKGR